MDTNKINKIYDLAYKIIENKKKLLERYKESNSYFTVQIESEINLLHKMCYLIHELVTEIKSKNQEIDEKKDLLCKVKELEEELKTTEEAYYAVSDMFINKFEHGS